MATKRNIRTLVGLDIEPGHVAAVQATVNGSIVVERAAVAELEPEVMRDGEVNDPESLTATLRDLFAEHKLARRVRIGVANQRIVMRTIDLPRIDDAKDLDAAVRFQAQEHIPMPLDQAVLDFESVGVVQTPEGERTRVVLVAARRDMVERLLAAARAAGLRPEGIDLSAFAMVRALDSGPSADPTLFLNVAGMTNIAVSDGSACRFTRVVAGGFEGMVGQLAERRALTLTHARQWLGHVGLSLPLEAVDGDAEIVAEARSVLADGARKVADEVRNSLDFHRNQEGGVDVGRAVLTGPAAAIPGFSEQLGGDLALPMEVRTVSEARPGAFAGVDAGRLTVAAGLAVGERPQ